jgi:hypothetical protein
MVTARRPDAMVRRSSRCSLRVRTGGPHIQETPRPVRTASRPKAFLASGTAAFVAGTDLVVNGCALLALAAD